jgi:hypothetical protein
MMNRVNTVPKMREPKRTARNTTIWSSASRLFENIKRNLWKTAVLLNVPPYDTVFRYPRIWCLSTSLFGITSQILSNKSVELPEFKFLKVYICRN